MTDTVATPTEPASAQAPAPSEAAPLEARVADLERRVENCRLIRDTWTLIIFAIAAVALLASVIAVGFGMRAIDESEQRASAPAATVLAAAAESPSGQS